MGICLMVGCGNKTGKKTKKGSENVIFYRIPRLLAKQGDLAKELSATRQSLWLSAISRDDLTDGKLENDRVCSKHFVSGRPAKDWDRFDVDWVPTLHLGHSKQLKTNVQVNVERLERRKL